MGNVAAEPKWDALITSIEQGKCVLFVGPESVMKAPGVLYHEELVKSPEFGDTDFNYIPRDEMFLVTEKKIRRRLVNSFRNYIQQNPFYDDTYKKIELIPFLTIISVSRYPFLVESFKNNNIDFEHRWFSKVFDKSMPTGSIADINDTILNLMAKIPLVYNLFGTIDIDDSLLLTHNDLFDYLTKLLSENAIPQELQEAVNQSTEIIFLGFKFERWYVQLLLRLFKLADQDPGNDRISVSKKEDDDILNICTKSFEMEFIDDNIDSFINTLYDKCKEKGKLRTPSVDAPFKALLRNNKFDDALKKLDDFEKKNGLNDSVTGLAGTWSAIQQSKAAGVYSFDELMRETNKFRVQLRTAIDNDLSQIT